MGVPLRPLLWSSFGLLVAAGAWLFLRACGLDALGLDYCPVPPDHLALLREVATGDGLQDQVHRAQMALAEQPLCTPPPAVPGPAPASGPIDRQVTERGGQSGRLQFTLLWNTLDDLDLNVTCPGGLISGYPGHTGPGVCGDGRKDLDANRNLVENVSSTPIENVVWQSDIPQGRYSVEVIEFRSKGDGANTVPFTLRLRWNGQERECHDVVTATASPSNQRDAEGAIGGTARTISWTLGPDLPSCDFQIITTHRGAPDK